MRADLPLDDSTRQKRKHYNDWYQKATARCQRRDKMAFVRRGFRPGTDSKGLVLPESTLVAPIETFAVSHAGILRRIRLADGRLVETLMGRAGLRRGETLDQRADRAV